MTVITVASTAALLGALRSAGSGDTIKLAGGTYQNVDIRGLNLSNVTVTSADTGRPAVFADLKVTGSSGIRFTDLDFLAGPNSANNSFLVGSSRHISFDRIEMSGPNNLGSGNEVSAFMIRSSSDISVTNSEFHHLWHGINMLDNLRVAVTGNSFHDIRTDGVRGGGNSDLTISRNIFTDFYPRAGDHPDAIQLWSTNATEPGRNIVISDNLVVRGAGAATQGIFIRDTYEQLHFENVSITGNLVVGALYHGITVSGVVGGVVANNQVVAFDDQMSWIRTNLASGVTVTGNRSSQFQIDSGATIPNASNSLQAPTTDNGSVAIGRWLADNAAFRAEWPGTGAVWSMLAVTPPTAGQLNETAPEYILVKGGAGADRLAVSEYGQTRIEGGGGNDTLTGGGARSQLVGGAGDDNYIIRSIGDVVIESAGGGSDTVHAAMDYRLTDNVETLRFTVGGLTGFGNALDNRLIGSAGDDRFYGLDGADQLQGGGGDDQLFGGAGDDRLMGDGGDDALSGDAGNDQLSGGDGADLLSGGAGNDVLEGGAGADRLTGGAGADEFRYRVGHLDRSSTDTVTDFMRGQDKISLAAIDAKVGTARNDAFTFIGTDGFHRVAGELRYVVVGGNAHVQGDWDGDGLADFTVIVEHVPVLGAADFLL